MGLMALLRISPCSSRRPSARTHSLWLRALLFIALISLSVPMALAQDEPDQSSSPLIGARGELEQIRGLMVYEDSLTPGSIEDLLSEVAAIRRTAIECAERSGAALDRLQRLEQIFAEPQPEAKPGDSTTAPAPTDATNAVENTDLREKQSELAAKRSQHQARLISCRLLELDSQELSYDLSKSRQALLRSAFLVRGPNVIEVVQQNFNNARAWIDAGSRLFRLVSGVEELGSLHSLGLLVCALLAGLLSARLRRLSWLEMASDSPEHFTNNLILAFGGVIHAYLPPLLILLAVNAYLAIFDLLAGGVPLVAQIASLALLMLVLAVCAKALLDPPSPARPLITIPIGQGHRLSLLLQSFALLLLIGLVLLRVLHETRFIDQAMRLLILDVYIALSAVNALLLLRQIGKGDVGARRLVRRTLPAIVVVTILIAAWVGYMDAARVLFWGSIGTGLSVLAALLGARLIDDLHNSLDEGRYGWQRFLRKSAGLEPNDPIPGLGWLTLLLQGGLWLLLGVFLLALWGVPKQVLRDVSDLFVDGIVTGSVSIVPKKIVAALLTLLLLIMASRWIARQLEHRWLLRTRMEQSAREAVSTTVGYVGIAAAILLTLSMAGIDFSNLAIIAGALSVGIGFGLQNVVNNFVSGLIMLVERPVKTGDWIVVGNTEGYVRRISIRTTIIQTFDRADVIVPNSELISNQVTNWMHSNTYGRFRVPVGVAYGSDTGRVHDLMLQVAENHPQVVRGFPSWPDPTVLFIGFGDSSLNFELRGIIYNIDMRMRVMSDLNFAIDKTFREHGIEIPFPQRVIHHAASGSGTDEPTDDPKSNDSSD